jgi:hypothetical protein
MESIAVDFLGAQRMAVVAGQGNCEENGTTGGGMTTRTVGLCGHRNKNQLNKVIKMRGTAKGGLATRGSGTGKQEGTVLKNVRQRRQWTRGGGTGEHEAEMPA